MLALVAPRRLPARSEIFWTLGSFLALTALFVLFVEVRHPEWYDREYQVRRTLLNERIAETPERPVVLVAGSSRVVVAFMPERLGSIRDKDGHEALIFNYAHLGAGPRFNLIQLHRALRDGVRPTHLVCEIAPGLLHHDDLPIKEIAIPDIALLWTHSNKVRLVASSIGYRLNGVYRPRTALLRSIAPRWVTHSAIDKDIALLEYGGDDHWSRLDEPSEHEQKLLYLMAVNRFQSRMETFRLDPYLVSATHELLEVCKREGIRLTMFLSPEDSRFRSWYRSGAEGVLAGFIAELRAAGVAVVDGRCWIPDHKFTDPHHLKTNGAEEFTDRLGRELLKPLISGQLGR